MYITLFFFFFFLRKYGIPIHLFHINIEFINMDPICVDRVIDTFFFLIITGS
jgi:hypothetical protein